jgi:pimeloyl-ACP methyl ester carboxylesterase
MTVRGHRRGLAVFLAAGILAIASPAGASHQAGHEPPPGPAKVNFPDDFPVLLDSEWDIPIGGFGGIRRGEAITRVPVILVHGNNVDHGDWYPVRDDFRAAGWSDQELWALSYNGLGVNNGSTPVRSNPEASEERAEMGGDGRARITANDVNVPDLAAFIRAVQDYTGSRHYSLVGHSLGVTVARKTLVVHPELADDLVAFVGIAGGNHGTSFCPPGSDGTVHGCDELTPGSPWLEELNGPDGERETYGDIRWLTIYDGSGATDVAFVGPEAHSPALLGADNRTFPGTDHNALRIQSDIVAVYREFLEEASAAVMDNTVVAPDAAGSPGPTDTIVTDTSGHLPASGGRQGLGLAAAALAVALAMSVQRRRSPVP